MKHALTRRSAAAPPTIAPMRYTCRLAPGSICECARAVMSRGASASRTLPRLVVGCRPARSAEILRSSDDARSRSTRGPRRPMSDRRRSPRARPGDTIDTQTSVSRPARSPRKSAGATPTTACGRSPIVTVFPTTSSAPPSCSASSTLRTAPGGSADESPAASRRPRCGCICSRLKNPSETDAIRALWPSSPIRTFSIALSSIAATPRIGAASSVMDAKSGYDDCPYGSPLSSLVKMSMSRDGSPTPAGPRSSSACSTP